MNFGFLSAAQPSRVSKRVAPTNPRAKESTCMQSALICFTFLFPSSAIAIPGCPPSVVLPERQDHPKLAPFTAVRWVGDKPLVRVDGTFYELLVLDGQPAASLVAFAKEQYGRRWAKRFSEDLVQLMTEMGHPPGPSVSMSLLDVEGSGKRIDRPKVAMTADNRSMAWGYNRNAEEDSTQVQRVQRTHAQRMSSQWKSLMAPDWIASPPSGWRSEFLTGQQVAEDLDELEWFLEDRYSYLHLTGFDYRSALDTLRIAGAQGMSRQAFALQLMKFLARFGDGHTRLNHSFGSIAPPGRSPFLLMDSKEGLVCVLGDRSGPLNTDYPFLEAIDGIPIERWIEASHTLSSAYSPAFSRKVAIENLRYLGWVAMEMGHDLGSSFEVELSKGPKRHKQQVPVAKSRAIYGSWPDTTSQRLEGDIGYLRIQRMARDDEFLAALRSQLESFMDSRGLIIDVRGNGGGTRDVLRLVLPYLMQANETPAVVNLARLKLGSEARRSSPSGLLADRFLYPASSPHWNRAEADAIGAFSKTFRPSWSPKADTFSDWHYMLISPNGKAFSKPVKVLIDSGCFSATDIFVSALKGRPGVEVIGLPTGGGSGRSKGIRLAHSGWKLRLSSMASFQVDGRPYDGVGIQPDLRIEPAAAYHWGLSDPALEAALERLR